MAIQTPLPAFPANIQNIVYAPSNTNKKLVVTPEILTTLFDKNTPFTRSEEVAETLFQQSRTSSKRYSFGGETTKREKALNLVFNEAFKNKPQEVIQAAEKAFPDEKQLYSPWKKVVWIDLPKMGANVTGNFFFKLAVAIAALYFTTKACNHIYSKIVQGVGHAIPYVINHTPVQVFRVGNKLLDIKDAAFNYKYRIIFFSAIAKGVVHILPTIPVVTPTIKAISIWKIFQTLFLTGTETTAKFIKDTANGSYNFVWGQCNNLSGIFREFAENNEREQFDLAKPKVFALWTKIVAETAPEMPAA